MKYIYDIYCNINISIFIRIYTQLEFLYCTTVGSKPGCGMPNMAVPDLNKI